MNINYFTASNISPTKKASDTPKWMDYFDVPEVYEDRVAMLRVIEFEKRINRLNALFETQGTLLDIGIATGEFMSLAKKSGWEVSGLDISDYSVERARNKFGIKAEVGDLLEKDFNGKKYDVIHLNHVFEHFVDPTKALYKIKKLMHPDSILMLEVPNQFDSLVRQTVSLFRCLYNNNQQKRSIYSIHHPYFYNAKNIQSLISQNDLEILTVKTHFPERWNQNIARKILKWVELIGDSINKRGDNIEVTAKLK